MRSGAIAILSSRSRCDGARPQHLVVPLVADPRIEGSIQACNYTSVKGSGDFHGSKSAGQKPQTARSRRFAFVTAITNFRCFAPRQLRQEEDEDDDDDERSKS